MKTGLAIAFLAGVFTLPAVALEDFQYNMNTGALPGTEMVAADVVRQPAFKGEKDEKVQAMDQAKLSLDTDYCQNRGGEFVVDNSMVIFDGALGVWFVGGICR